MGLGFYGIAGAALNGLNSGLDEAYIRNRQAKLDAQNEKEFALRNAEMEAQKRQRENAEAIEKARTETIKNKGITEEDAPTITVDGNTYEAPGLNKDTQIGASETPISQSQGRVVVTPDGQRKVFKDQASADAFKSSYTPNEAALHQMLAKRFEGMEGGEKHAQQAIARARELQANGMVAAYDALGTGDAEGAMAALRQVKGNIPEGTKFAPQTSVDPITNQKKTVWQVVDGKGNVLVPDFHGALEQYVLTPQERIKNEIERDKIAGDQALKEQLYSNKAEIAAQRLAVGGMKPIGPKITTHNVDGVLTQTDDNSGAVGTYVPEQPAKPKVKHWLSPDEPAQEAVPAHFKWASVDGKPMAKGPQELYSQLPVNKQPGAAGSEAQLRSQMSDMGADPKAILREIQQSTADLARVKDEKSASDLRAHIEDMKRQYQNLQQGQQAAGGFVAGQTYTDSKGNKAKFDGRNFVAVN